MFKFFPFYLSVDPYQVFFQYVLYFFQHIMHTVPHYDRYRYNTRTQQTNILINKTKDKSTMPQGSQHHHTGRKRSKDRDADMHASRLVADVDEFADLDEKRYQMTLTKWRKGKKRRKKKKIWRQITSPGMTTKETIKKTLCRWNRIRKPNRKIKIRIPISIESERYAPLLKPKDTHLYRKRKILSYLSLR